MKHLEAFSHGQIQDALNIMNIMQKKSLSVEDLKEYMQNMIPGLPNVRKGFMRRTTEAERIAMKAQKGLIRQPCKTCSDKKNKRPKEG